MLRLFPLLGIAFWVTSAYVPLAKFEIWDGHRVFLVKINSLEVPFVVPRENMNSWESPLACPALKSEPWIPLCVPVS